MRSTRLSALLLAAALLVPGLAHAESGVDSTDNAPGVMMWGGGPGMMWGNGEGWGPGMMGRGGGYGYGYGMMGGCPMAGMMGGNGYQRSVSAWIDGQLAYAHTALAITAAQEPKWKEYADALHDRSAQMLATHQTMMGAWRNGGLPLNEAYDLHIKLMQDRLDAMKTSRDKVLDLYNALTPEQQKAASWILPQSMCMM